jgi:hypothetical protein
MEGKNPVIRGNSAHREVARVQKRICSLAIFVSLGAASGLIIMGQNAIAKGLLLGTLFSIANFVLLGFSVPLTIGKTRTRASFMSLTSLLIRFALLAIPMVVGMKSAAFSFGAVVVGVFSIQIITLVEYLVVRPIQDGKQQGAAWKS